MVQQAYRQCALCWRTTSHLTKLTLRTIRGGFHLIRSLSPWYFIGLDLKIEKRERKKEKKKKKKGKDVYADSGFADSVPFSGRPSALSP